MLERFVKQTKYASQEDFIKNFKIEVPENFNFGYDVVDAWAAEQPDKKAILWTNDQGLEHQYTYAELKERPMLRLLISRAWVSERAIW